MDPIGIVIWLVLGAVAGWLAGIIMKTGSGSVLRNIIVGIVGAFLGGILFSLLGLSAGGGLIGSIITAVIGAVALLFGLRLIGKG